MITDFKYGLTIKELKEILANLPDSTEDGDSNEVWIRVGRNLTSPVTQVSTSVSGDLFIGRIND